MVTGFKRRLAETIACCLPRAEAARAGVTTRSVELMPPVCGHDGDTLVRQLLSSKAVPAEAVGFIVERRRRALERLKLPLPPLGDLMGGRVFATDFNSDLCGAATAPSNGYLDDYDIPGWDTWFAHEPVGEFGGVVYGWVPPVLLELAGQGFDVIPVSSVWWVEDPELRGLMET
ncbi:hypothetical protein LXT21_32730 [Myxococcus sp. K38C18041901]|uniref:hypothetical protein n=1 Tax=Myxococcus guangdongensis TaxID=2906760 RepID=UPI0020A77C1C|nr:hypothetical protein [Myxococcus guangdongensis]MCP3063554.1 hypothetical protein [Myxococcus guangdongensis]